MSLSYFSNSPERIQYYNEVGWLRFNKKVFSFRKFYISNEFCFILIPSCEDIEIYNFVVICMQK
jgi:hypothetical protein